MNGHQTLHAHDCILYSSGTARPPARDHKCFSSTNIFLTFTIDQWADSLPPSTQAFLGHDVSSDVAVLNLKVSTMKMNSFNSWILQLHSSAPLLISTECTWLVICSHVVQSRWDKHQLIFDSLKQYCGLFFLFESSCFSFQIVYIRGSQDIKKTQQRTTLVVVLAAWRSDLDSTRER